MRPPPPVPDRPAPRPASPDRAGFTLIETMVAVVILATAMLAVLSVCVAVQDARLRALRVQAAALTLQDRLADMTAFGVNRLEARQGTRETVSGDWRWRVDVATAGLPGLSLATVAVEPDAAPEVAARATVLAGRR